MKRNSFLEGLSVLLFLFSLFSCAGKAFGYSVLTHEAIIDSAWTESLTPLLLKRFPGASADDLDEAHAYAYGGCTIQDMGYYPFASRFFSDIVHCVRSGDFVKALIEDSLDINEFAFALGALAHYSADTKGHPIAINRAVPLVYKKLAAKFGNEVTFADSPKAHLRLEFGLDVLQVARGRYAHKAYRDFIGFKVSKPLLERAFHKTYGLELKDIFFNLDLALGTYRRSVSTIIPKMTRVAWEMKKDEIERLNPGVTNRTFIYNLSRGDYEKEWGKEYKKPGFFSKVLALLLGIVPRLGPFRALSFKPPTPEAERLFMESFNVTLNFYRALVQQQQAGQFDLKNHNLDVGRPTRAGEYEIADEAYAKLLEELAEEEFQNVTPDLRSDILTFYSDLTGPIATKKKQGHWRRTLAALDALRTRQLWPAPRSEEHFKRVDRDAWLSSRQ